MTFSATGRSAPGPDGNDPAPLARDRALVLVSGGRPGAVRALLEQAAPCLAEVLGLPLCRLGPATAELPADAGGDPAPAAAPPALLAELNQQPPALAWLPLDPGTWLGPAGTWAEALGAWRQPVLALIPADDLTGGLAASLTALLHQQRVPLVGLVQWQGVWRSEDRRADGLPWLGAWPASGDDPEPREQAIAALASVLACRWQRLLA